MRERDREETFNKGKDEKKDRRMEERLGEKRRDRGTGEMLEGVRERRAYLVFVMCSCECECASTRSKRVHEGFDNKKDRKKELEYENISGIKTTKGRKKSEEQLKKKKQNRKDEENFGNSP